MKIQTMVMLWSLVLLSAGYYQKNLGVSFFQLHVPRAYDEDHRDRGWPFHNAKRSCEYFFLLFLATNIHSCWLKTLFHYAKRSREYFLAIYPPIHSYWLKTCIVSLCFTVQSARVSIYSSLLLAASCWLKTLFLVRTSVNEVHSEAPGRRGCSRDQTLHQEFI